MTTFLPIESHDGVLIVGAGPTGLTLANALAFYGVPFTIIDSKTGPTRDSKALAVNAASRFGLDLIGLSGVLGQSGSRLHRLNLNWQGRRLSAVDLRHLDYEDAFFLAQPQSDTENELITALSTYGQRVRWETGLVDADKRKDGVRVALKYGNGTQIERIFPYVVGCDGKESIVRNRMSVNFSGCDYPMHFVLGDFALSWDASRNEAYYFVYEETFFILVPAGKDLWRIVVKYDGTIPDTPVHARDITDVVTAYMGEGFFLGDPAWISRAPFYMRTSDRLRDGPLFLAGDAAHLFSPIGGTGMNTGMQDALNLGWKIAYHYTGRGGETLLDSYATERIHAIRATAKVTDQSTRLIARIDKDPSAVERMLPEMRNRPFLRSAGPLKYSGLGISYSETLLADGGTPVPGSRRAGELCLGIGRLLMTKESPVRSLPPFVVVAFVLNNSQCGNSLCGLEDLSELQGEYLDALRTEIIVMDADAESIRSAYPRLNIHLAKWELIRALGGARDALLLISPDGVIRYSGSYLDVKRLRDTLIAYFDQSTVVRRNGRSRIAG